MATVPDWLRGVWQRTRIDHADGTRDTTTRVFWLQGLSCYGDLRIAASRPQVSGFGASAQANRAMAHQQGATGHCHCPVQQATWQRQWGYQPVVDFPEPGDLERRDDIVIERAPSGAYEEEWQRLTPPDPCIHVWQRDDGLARLLVIDAFAMLVSRRRRELEPRPLPALLGSGHTPVSELLDCEISYAVREGPDDAFIVRLSTLPWREGRPLALGGTRGGIVGQGWFMEEHHPGDPVRGAASANHGMAGNGTRLAGQT